MGRKPKSKNELIEARKLYEALQKDEDDLATKTVIWRMGVQVGCALHMSEKFSQMELYKFFSWIREEDVHKMTDERRKKISKMLSDRKVMFCVREDTPKCFKGSYIERVAEEQKRYNTEKTTDYMLLTCEYLITHKGYGRKRLDRVFSQVAFMDRFPAQAILDARQELYEKTMVWIELSDDNPDNPTMII